MEFSSLAVAIQPKITCHLDVSCNLYLTNERTRTYCSYVYGRCVTLKLSQERTVM